MERERREKGERKEGERRRTKEEEKVEVGKR